MLFGNLAVILIFFATPRFKFIQDHWGASYEQILESPGTADNPNIYQPTYIISHRIREKTTKDSTIIMTHPFGALIFKKKPYDSIGIFAAFDALYPRKIFWERFSQTSVPMTVNENIFRVTYEGGSNKCQDHMEKKLLDYQGWLLCPAVNLNSTAPFDEQ